MLHSLKSASFHAENRVHFSLTWPFGSLTRPSGSARCASRTVMGDERLRVVRRTFDKFAFAAETPL